MSVPVTAGSSAAPAEPITGRDVVLEAAGIRKSYRVPTGSLEVLAKVKPVNVVGVRAEALLVELNDPPAVSQPRLLLGLVEL